MTLDDDIALAHQLADAAGAVIRPYFRARFAQEAKEDASPVTQADREAEAAIRSLIAAHRPGDGIIGEEYGAEHADAERIWVLDPIDGTRAFIGGRPIFGTMIALMVGGRPVLGVIDQPISGERWIGAAGQPTLFNGRPAHTRPCTELSRALFATTAPWFCGGFDALRSAAGDTLLGGDCYNYALLASGHADLVVEEGLKLHDWAALLPVVEGAGGRMTDWEGHALHKGSDGRVVAVGDPALLPHVLGLLER
ncbi:putative histidinol-phosphate phosphatase [Sphingomonas changbaiensis NBRC 104936]|uniref:Histidinol-phosphatase n=1 Tax=Sphingomonas changbaiensis NBRC 104936 TaxID=1219043 RepID=A0A0E9MQS6_9SPHN|nr:histidinol-phosphatase [Sphingomonas changbaiensis]GAO40127.1 putative histidinol-phosphate phosphatase [Sphingomonas changbaiensis NBRC 104936]